jgi:polysaccharide biosynthesis protein PslH
VSQPRRLLFLAPFAPRLDAPHGGGRSIAQIVTGLAARHRVVLLCLRGPDEPAADPLLHERCERVEEISRPAIVQTNARRLRLLAGLLRGQPMWASDWAVPAFARRVRALAREWQPEVVQIEFHIMAQYLPALAGCPAPRVLVVHEPGTAASADQNRTLRGAARLLGELDRLAWRRFERRVAQNVQGVVVFTERDRDSVKRLAPTAPLHCIPLGTPVLDEALNPLGEAPPSLLFVGGFGHPPNVEAARRLVSAIFPAVRARCPDAELFLVGSNPPTDLAPAGAVGITATGFVPDVAPFLDRAALVVVPLRQGGGMRVKVLEALAAGKAVVASPLAIEGLALRDGEQLLVAQSDAEFVEAILRLLQEPDRRVALARRARAWATSNLGWEGPLAAYERLYQQLLPPTGNNRAARAARGEVS